MARVRVQISHTDRSRGNVPGRWSPARDYWLVSLELPGERPRVLAFEAIDMPPKEP